LDSRVKIALMQLYWWVPMRAITYALAPATVSGRFSALVWAWAWAWAWA